MSQQNLKVLYKNPDPSQTLINQFRLRVNQQTGLSLNTYSDLYKWSIDYTSEFWKQAFLYCKVRFHGELPDKVVDESKGLTDFPDWFSGITLNFAENILYSGGSNPYESKEDSKVAVIPVREGGAISNGITWGELRHKVGLVSNAMRQAGITPGDRVGVVAGNHVLSLIVVLSAATVGAIMTLSSPDIGVKGVLDRLQQVEPKIVFYDSTATYNGKTVTLSQKVKDIYNGLKDGSNYKHSIVFGHNYNRDSKLISQINGEDFEESFVNRANGSNELVFEQLKFRDPAAIVYSSGTTGVPKCIVHCAGGLSLVPKTQAMLHCEVDGENSTYLQFTTTGWIMYFIGILAPLCVGSKVILFDGSPFYKTPYDFIKVMEKLNVTHLGTSPRYLSELKTRGINPRDHADVSNLKLITVTGMPMPQDVSEWIYNSGFLPEVRLADSSGGTEVVACFVHGNDMSPLYSGRMQAPCLGMKIAAIDNLQVQGDELIDPIETRPGTPGELCCLKPFPSMPVTFWGKGGQEKYLKAYFSRFKGIWSQGDFIIIEPENKGIMILGRSDGVLNPSGIRFGSGDIYSVVSKFNQIQDSICVGQRRPHDNDETVVLFIKMKDQEKFTSTLEKSLKQQISSDLSIRHVPKYIFQTPDIPSTVTGKKVELPVKQIISGNKNIKASSSISNPESLEYFYQFVDIENIQLNDTSSKL